MPNDPTPEQLSAYFATLGRVGGKRRKELHPAVPSEQFKCSCKNPDGTPALTHTPFRTTCRPRGFNEWQRRRRERKGDDDD